MLSRLQRNYDFEGLAISDVRIKLLNQEKTIFLIDDYDKIV